METVTRRLAPVEELYSSNFRDAASTLREIASEIERGTYGEVGCVAVAIWGDRLEVFGMGPDSDGSTVHLILCAAARKLEEPVLEIG